MGFFRALFAYLIRNEQVINKLADTKPIRRSAQFVAYLLLQSRTHGIPLPFNREELVKRFRSITYRLKDKVQEVKNGIKKNSPK